MERVVKGFAGYSREKENKPATHVILTIEEYNNFLQNLQQAKEETQKIVRKCDREITAYKKQANDLIAKEKQQCENRLNALKNDLNNSKGEIDRLNDLNANLTRIMRERANAKRGLKPKKLHHGYMVLDSQQFTYIHNVKGNTKKLPCWKVRIQSAHDSSIPYNIIVKDIHDDLIKIFGSSLGISSIYSDLDKFGFEEIQKLWDNEKNFIFKTSYKANIKSGFWEIEYLVKSSIKIPADMRIG